MEYDIEKVISQNVIQYPNAHWLTNDLKKEMELIRQKLIDNFFVLGGETIFHKSKYFTHAISPGCKKCGNGAWSCLFINNKCNAKCFYCPTNQDKIDMPSTNTLNFPQKKDYLAYFQAGNFSGFSISGGEPFLTFEKTIEFLTAMQNRFSDKVYKWLYTNGILLTQEKLLLLHKAGLDELRIDLSAINYDVKPLISAKQLIENVTVEIPAIPEDEEKLKTMLKNFRSIGISFLNLHQLRVTPFNFSKLTNKNYTFLHGQQVTVLESELTAFRLMNFNLEQNIGLPINYCSYIYKNRFQNSASRHRWAKLWQEPLKEISQNGYVRKLTVKNDEDLKKQLYFIDKSGINWVDKKTILQISSAIIHLLPTKETQLTVEYFSVQLLNQPTYHHNFQEIKISNERSLYLEKQKVDSFTISLTSFRTLVISDFTINDDIIESECEKLLNYELIKSGLLPYS